MYVYFSVVNRHPNIIGLYSNIIVSNYITLKFISYSIYVIYVLSFIYINIR